MAEVCGRHPDADPLLARDQFRQSRRHDGHDERDHPRELVQPDAHGEPRLDGAGHATEVSGNIFLRATRWFIDAPDLAAGGNYWATADAPAATAKVKGRISVLPWKPATAAGY